MKKILFLLMAMLLSFSMYAQKNVTTFLGIPIDGTKAVMRQKLISKGFTPFRIGGEEVFRGEFNGEDVIIGIVTNNNKVYRLAVFDTIYRNEAEIKIRFNNLVSQFENNKRYFSLGEYTISDDEDISDEMIAHAKNYDATYFQRPVTAKKRVWFRIEKCEYIYDKYYIAMFYDNEYNMANGEDL